jgi:hypothetical protein
MNREPAGCYSIVYSSEATIDFKESALLQLLKRARGFHEQAGITGVLMYGNGRFLQIMEGSPAAVRSLYARVAALPNHGRHEMLANGLVAGREFTDWYMSFAPPPAGFQSLPGYLTPPQLVLASAGTTVQPLLSEFMTSCFELVNC